MLKKLALAVMILCSSATAQNVTAPATLEPGQIYNTGNLVVPTTTTSGSTWVNGVYQDQLTCFAWGDPGYCGPNPIVRPNGNINFSYGWTDLYQQINLATNAALSVTGLRVNGYNFGFTAKNGNGWDDGRTDLLFAYVQFNDKNNNPLINHTHNLNSNFGWTNFNFNKDFDSPYSLADLSTVRYGFVGRDNNGWAGPYGPEIRDVSFSLKYSVDPCKTDPLYSPTCPGYMEALAKLLPPAPVVDTTASIITEAPAAVTAIATDSPVGITASTTSTSAASSSAASTAAPVAGREQSGSNRTDNSLALSIISRNQQREQSIAAQAVQTAISTANDSSQASQQEAAAVAAAAVVNSTAAGSSGSGTVGGIGIKLGSMSASIGSAASADLSAGPESVSRLGNMLTDRTNPLNEYIDPRPPLSTNIAVTGPVVNRNAADNEAAGGVDLAKMAIAPSGYNDYLTLALRDAAFYAPREVYRNQRNVDNQRALRQLTNDSRHREMVEQQYRR